MSTTKLLHAARSHEAIILGRGVLFFVFFLGVAFLTSPDLNSTLAESLACELTELRGIYSLDAYRYLTI